MKKFENKISKVCKDSNERIIKENGHFLTKWGTFKADIDPDTGKDKPKKRGKHAS